jgi:hypothetical protein
MDCGVADEDDAAGEHELFRRVARLSLKKIPQTCSPIRQPSCLQRFESVVPVLAKSTR